MIDCVPFISVVIPTYNRANNLKECLKSLERQTKNKDRFEVVVVNDGSIDSTIKVVESIIKNNKIELKFLSQDNAGVSSARNRGINEARGVVVAFTDDDCIVPPDWIEKLELAWRNCELNVAGIGGPLNTVTDNANSFISQFLFYIDEFNHIPVARFGLIRPVHISRLKGDEIIPYLRTANASFRKSCLLEVGGFDPVFCRPGGEDPDLCYRLLSKGYQFHLQKDLVASHYSRDSIKAYLGSLSNYVKGDIIKSRKLSLYPSCVRNNYRYVLAQKLLSIIISFIFIPLTTIRLLCQGEGNILCKIAFPFFSCYSRIYAFFSAVFAKSKLPFYFGFGGRL